MDVEPVDVVAAIYRAINEGRPELFALLAPDIRWITPGGLPWGLPDSGGRYVGHEQLGAYFQNALQEVDALRVEVDDLISFGDAVLMIGRERGTSRVTGRAFTSRCAHLWTIKGGVATTLEGFPDTDAMWAAFDR